MVLLPPLQGRGVAALPPPDGGTGMEDATPLARGSSESESSSGTAAAFKGKGGLEVPEAAPAKRAKGGAGAGADACGESEGAAGVGGGGGFLVPPVVEARGPPVEQVGEDVQTASFNCVSSPGDSYQAMASSCDPSGEHPDSVAIVFDSSGVGEGDRSSEAKGASGDGADKTDGKRVDGPKSSGVADGTDCRITGDEKESEQEEAAGFAETHQLNTGTAPSAASSEARDPAAIEAPQLRVRPPQEVEATGGDEGLASPQPSSRCSSIASPKLPEGDAGHLLAPLPDGTHDAACEVSRGSPTPSKQNAISSQPLQLEQRDRSFSNDAEAASKSSLGGGGGAGSSHARPLARRRGARSTTAPNMGESKDLREEFSRELIAAAAAGAPSRGSLGSVTSASGCMSRLSVDNHPLAPPSGHSPSPSPRAKVSFNHGFGAPMGESSTEEENDSATKLSRRPSISSHRSFCTGDLAPASAKHMRRQASLIVASELNGSSAQATADEIQTLLDSECVRLSSKIHSQAYENDRNKILLERQLSFQSSHSQASNPRRRSRAPSSQADFHSIGPRHRAKDADADDERGEEEDSVHGRPGMAKVDGEDLTKYLGWVSAMKWGVTVLIAMIMAFEAGGIIMGSHDIVHWKLIIAEKLSGSSHNFGHVAAFGFLLSYSLPASIVAALLVTYVAPHAGGSGIPEIKAFLNGINMPKAFTFRTWLARSVGLLLVTSAGLFAGTEGPFAHLGGIVAAAFSDGPTWRGKSYWPVVLMGHQNKCEFISQGAAMGVAAAFGAPVGGILFSLEEASSFWSKSLTWRAFLGTMVAAVLAKLVKAGFTHTPISGFIEFPDKDASFLLWELGLFALLATVTGLMGALFCNIVKRMFHFRRRFFFLGSPTKRSKRMRLCEVVVIVIFTVAVCFWPAVIVGCRPLPFPDPRESSADSSHHRRLMTEDAEERPHLGGIVCVEDEYSDIAYILLASKERVIKTLFSHTMAEGAHLSIPGLIASYAIIYVTTILTFGSAIPVGLFVPNILAGACLGRATGESLIELGIEVHPGVYALMGAAGALGGFSRMTISLVVIFIEITNNMYLLLPLMLVIMWSKQLADRFGPSVYDIVLEANPDIHLLEDALHEDHRLVLDGLTTHDICTAEVVVVRAFEPPEQIMKLLLQTTFGGYPIVDREGRLTGLVPRHQLVASLAQRKLDPASGGGLISLQRLAESAPEVTNWKTPVVRAFAHFRALGLQHLCVIDEQHTLLGILTRTDFARLCKSGHEGVEEVRALINRKCAALAAGIAVQGQYPRAGWKALSPRTQAKGSTTPSQVSDDEAQNVSAAPLNSMQSEPESCAESPSSSSVSFRQPGL